MIDIHSHILPDLDDGSESIEMSLNIARQYIENGINKVIATPHHISGADNASREEILIKIEELRKELFRAAIPLEVYPGNEVMASNSIPEDIIEKKICTLNNSKYVLIELPLNNMPLYMESLIYNILIKGYVPIIAHPERNVDITRDPNIMHRFIELGALAQLNILSLEGFYGSKVKYTAETLLREQIYDFVATDTHSDRHRSPNIKKPLKRLEALTNKSYYNKLISENGQRVLDNKDIIKKEAYKKKKDSPLVKAWNIIFSKI